jgi:tripartite-type tricarboxylate transporter receptor subunit TctC
MKRMILALAALCALPAAQAADSYPNHTISMIVPYAAGGSTDALARIVANAMGRNLGQTIVVENLGGGGTIIGNSKVIRSPADGYTITFGNMGSLAIAAPLYPQAKFDPRRDMAAIGLVATVPMVLSVSKASGVQNMDQFLAKLRGGGHGVNFGHSGPGSTGHIAAAYFMAVTNTTAVQVPYRGAGPAIADLMAGTVDAVIDQTVTMIPIHKGNRVTAIAVSSPERLPQIPDVPTFKEAGVPKFDLSVWNGIAAPAATPAPVIQRLAQALDAALKDKDVVAQMEQLAAQVPPPDEQGPAPFQALIARDVTRFDKLIKDAGITVN